ncbi:hypothetical protein [Saccharopolyspora sp. ASAGF58]|uniref:hypothetical protein n=1 Tax=Saccharopolyspora sp. ASAGF58 TaxID=2719023 RepID=UPI00144011F5|nr:hypothetical protein [Saccharopolyspora sp. ASAGF58]QIZ37408.1 hypothetical protein FDZ84_25940 [Saccharopolyspora sp. ASAGF58]
MLARVCHTIATLLSSEDAGSNIRRVLMNTVHGGFPETLRNIPCGKFRRSGGLRQQRNEVASAVGSGGTIRRTDVNRRISSL